MWLRGSAEKTGSGDGNRRVSVLTSTEANRIHPSASTCTRCTPARVVTSTCRGMLAAGAAGDTSCRASTTRCRRQPRVRVGFRSPWLATQVVVVSPSRTAPACAAGSETSDELATAASDGLPTTSRTTWDSAVPGTGTAQPVTCADRGERVLKVRRNGPASSPICATPGAQPEPPDVRTQPVRSPRGRASRTASVGAGLDGRGRTVTSLGCTPETASSLMPTATGPGRSRSTAATRIRTVEVTPGGTRRLCIDWPGRNRVSREPASVTTRIPVVRAPSNDVSSTARRTLGVSTGSGNDSCIHWPRAVPFAPETQAESRLPSSAAATEYSGPCRTTASVSAADDDAVTDASRNRATARGMPGHGRKSLRRRVPGGRTVLNVWVALS